MDRKERLRQVMKEEAETISKAADRIDYDVMSQIMDLFCTVKKKGKKMEFRNHKRYCLHG